MLLLPAVALQCLLWDVSRVLALPGLGPAGRSHGDTALAFLPPTMPAPAPRGPRPVLVSAIPAVPLGSAPFPGLRRAAQRSLTLLGLCLPTP